MPLATIVRQTKELCDAAGRLALPWTRGFHTIAAAALPALVDESYDIIAGKNPSTRRGFLPAARGVRSHQAAADGHRGRDAPAAGRARSRREHLRAAGSAQRRGAPVAGEGGSWQERLRRCAAV